MNQTNLKTLIPALVGAFILVYEASTGHVVDSNTQSVIINEGLTLVGVVGTVWGIYKNHKGVK